MKWALRRSRVAGSIVLHATPSPRDTPTVTLSHDAETHRTTVYRGNLALLVIGADGSIDVGQGMPTPALARYCEHLLRAGLLKLSVEAKAGVL